MSASAQSSESLQTLLWTRFLCRHCACEYRELDMHLTVPPDPSRPFVFMQWPPPHTKSHKRSAVPLQFHKQYVQGKNPDGCYCSEINDAKKRFNLFERVSAHLPHSRPWFLKHLAPFLAGECPSIEFSAVLLENTLADLGLQLLDYRGMEGWESVDPQGLERVQARQLQALAELGLPETLGLLFALQHLAVWHGTKYDLQSALHIAVFDALHQFSRTPVLSDDWKERDIVETLCQRLREGSNAVARWGARSRPERYELALPKIPGHLVLVDARANLTAPWRCLQAGGDFAFELFFQQPNEYFIESCWPSNREAVRAAMAMRREAMRLPGLLETIATARLGGMDGTLPHRPRPWVRDADEDESSPIASAA